MTDIFPKITRRFRELGPSGFYMGLVVEFGPTESSLEKAKTRLRKPAKKLKIELH